MNYEYHEVANIFPLLQSEEFDVLKRDVAENGLIEPIWLHDGKIIDGRNRYRACIETGTQPRFRTWQGDGSLVEFVVSLNLHRRHLTSSQRAAVAVDILPMLEAEAKERHIRLAGRPSTNGGNNSTVFEPTGKARDQAAAATNTNPRYVSDAKKLHDEAPDLYQQVRDGTLSIPEAKREIKRKERAEYIERQREEIETGVAVLPNGLFEVLVVDPPWPYGTQYDPNGRRAANPYPEMSLEEIRSIDLPSADDAVLWLWTTHKFMRYSFELLDVWGFRDVAILTWVKSRMGLGSWLRSQSEFCIMAVKGRPTINLTNQTTVIHGAMREHSRKPDEFYQMVDELCIGRRLDYFSREQRYGWATFGNEVEKFHVRVA